MVYNAQQSHSAVQCLLHEAVPVPEAVVLLDRGIQGAREQTIVRTADQLGGDFVLEDLQGCTVLLLGRLSALRIRHLQNCRIACGPVAGATFVDGTSPSPQQGLSYTFMQVLALPAEGVVAAGCGVLALQMFVYLMQYVCPISLHSAHVAMTSHEN